MADIFISYARADRPVAERLAQDLAAHGYSVWWDAELLGSDDFRNVIRDELEAATVCIVIWSPASVKSRFVRDEADYALHRRKLIATRVTELPVGDIPFGFRGQNTDLVWDFAKVRRAVARFGGAEGQAYAEAQGPTYYGARPPGLLGIAVGLIAAARRGLGITRATTAPPRWYARRFSFLVSVALLLVVVASFVALHFLLAKAGIWLFSGYRDDKFGGHIGLWLASTICLLPILTVIRARTAAGTLGFMEAIVYWPLVAVGLWMNILVVSIYILPGSFLLRYNDWIMFGILFGTPVFLLWAWRASRKRRANWADPANLPS